MPDSTRLRQLATFRVGPLHLGVPVLHVQELIRAQPMTRVPTAPPAVRGLINLRGQIVTALDLGQRFGFPVAGDDAMHVVVRTDEGAVSLMVDAIGDVSDVVPEQFEPAPDTLAPGTRRLLTGVHKLQDRLLLELDVSAAVAVEHP